MDQHLLFPFHDYWWFYLSFTVFVLAVLLLDLGVFHKKSHTVSMKEAGIWSVVWIAMALLFNYLFYEYTLNKFTTYPELAPAGLSGYQVARQAGLEFLTGYIIEKSLSVDNLFVFVVIFSYFKIPLKYQHKVLFYGILGALIFRAIFIGLGSILMQYQFVVILLGIFLIFTGIKLMFGEDEMQHPENNFILKNLQKYLPVHNKLEDGRFLFKENGKWMVTPLFIALMFIEISDVMFAIDSVPAIFAVTKEPLIVFTSNIFAILGLRSLFFLLANVVDKFYLLKYALSIVLVFIGLKMVWLNKLFDGHFPTVWSLGIIGTLIFGSVILSLLFPKNIESKT